MWNGRAFVFTVFLIVDNGFRRYKMKINAMCIAKQWGPRVAGALVDLKSYDIPLRRFML